MHVGCAHRELLKTQRKKGGGGKQLRFRCGSLHDCAASSSRALASGWGGGGSKRQQRSSRHEREKGAARPALLVMPWLWVFFAREVWVCTARARQKPPNKLKTQSARRPESPAAPPAPHRPRVYFFLAKRLLPRGPKERDNHHKHTPLRKAGCSAQREGRGCWGETKSKNKKRREGTRRRAPPARAGEDQKERVKSVCKTPASKAPL